MSDLVSYEVSDRIATATITRLSNDAPSSIGFAIPVAEVIMMPIAANTVIVDGSATI